jgi:hypothetical protein
MPRDVTNPTVRRTVARNQQKGGRHVRTRDSRVPVQDDGFPLK